MTVAIGLVANSGIVLAADTQMTIPGFWKAEGGKFQAYGIRTPGHPSGACVVTGATTNINFLHALGDELMGDFRATVQDADKATAFERFQPIVHDFHYRHVAPEPTPQSVSVLVGYQRDGDLALWQSDLSVFIEQPHYAAVGSGAYLALAWLERVYRGPNDLASAVVLATFAAKAAKDNADGVGNRTDVFVVEADRYRIIDHDIVREIDALYESLTRDVQPDFIHDCLGESDPNRKRRVTGAQLIEQVKDVTTRLKASTPEAVKQWRRERWERLRAESDQRRSTENSPNPPPLPE